MPMNDMTRPANRVPEVTLDFWLIKLMAVTMGETAADYLAVNLGLGLTTTSRIMTGVLVVALAVQFFQRRYVPWAYWLAVVLISIVGTLVTDNLVDNFGVPLTVTTAVFTVALAVTFLIWQRVERTLSIHDGPVSAARHSTGWRSCSPSRWGQRRGTLWLSSSGLGIWRRGSCSG